MKQIIEPIGFMIEGENIVVTNPCTIPIEMLEDALKKPREKNKVSAYFMIKILLPEELRKGIKKHG